MNKSILMGRLTKDPELRYTSANNVAYCSFTLAVDRRFSKQGEEAQTDFIPIVAWSKLGEFCAKYFQKGLKISVVGRIQTRSWDGEDGKKRYATEVVAEEAYFAESKKASEAGGQFYSESSNGSNAGQSEGFFTTDNGNDELPF